MAGPWMFFEHRARNESEQVQRAPGKPYVVIEPLRITLICTSYSTPYEARPILMSVGNGMTAMRYACLAHFQRPRRMFCATSLTVCARFTLFICSICAAVTPDE
jgi:hypothetical protein